MPPAANVIIGGYYLSIGRDGNSLSFRGILFYWTDHLCLELKGHSSVT